jgi:hypothetical protein
VFIIHPGRIFFTSAALAAMLFYGGHHSPSGFVSYVAYGWGAFFVCSALAALRWIWRGLVGFLR